MHDIEQTRAYITALPGRPDTVMDWRCLHDTDASRFGENRRGTLDQVSEWLTAWQSRGYGVFVCINDMDGAGRKLENVRTIRTHVIDLDNVSAQQNYELSTRSHPAPSFAVGTSPGKFHVYWPVEPYAGNDRYSVVQRKLRQGFDGDPKVFDPTRVLRVPGSLHLKNPETPHPVTCWGISNQRTSVEALESALSSVHVLETSITRKDLGDPELAAPSIDWIKYGLDLIDPNDLARDEWIAILAAVKQSGWTLASDGELFTLFSDWCARYDDDNPPENQKQWNSITETQLGWKSLVSRIPGLSAALSFQNVDETQKQADTASPMPTPTPPEMDCSGPYLNHLEQQEWFKGCVYVAAASKVMTPEGRFFNQGQFNAMYGGKKFVIDDDTKTTLVPWEAVFKNVLWSLPKADHVRFLPHKPFGEMTMDNLGREGINLYKPSIVKRMQGDASPYISHVAKMLPDPGDQQLLHTYLGHNIKYPGHKIPWAPVIQSAEGAGKGVFKRLMRHALGSSYVHYPNAKELADSGSKFNSWMRYKLFLIADEIKVDDRREMIEILKDMISETEIEMQAKGYDQQIEDNFSNWLFFTNWKNAVPTSKNGRRFAIFYSIIQSEEDLVLRQMGKAYFDRLYTWFDKEDGAAIVTNWYHSLDIAEGSIPMRAPRTSSYEESLIKSRSAVENTIHEAIDSGMQGFRNGWVSSVAINKRLQECDMRKVSATAIDDIMSDMSYNRVGRSLVQYME